MPCPRLVRGVGSRGGAAGGVALCLLGSKEKLGAGPGRGAFAEVFRPPDPPATCLSASALGASGSTWGRPPSPTEELEGLGQGWGGVGGGVGAVGAEVGLVRGVRVGFGGGGG